MARTTNKDYWLLLLPSNVQAKTSVLPVLWAAPTTTTTTASTIVKSCRWQTRNIFQEVLLIYSGQKGEDVTSKHDRSCPGHARHRKAFWCTPEFFAARNPTTTGVDIITDILVACVNSTKHGYRGCVWNKYGSYNWYSSTLRSLALQTRPSFPHLHCSEEWPDGFLCFSSQPQLIKPQSNWDWVFDSCIYFLLFDCWLTWVQH